MIIQKMIQLIFTGYFRLNISDCLFSLMAIYIIGNPRGGIAVYMSYLISDMSISHLMIFIFASLIAVSISLILCLKLGDSFSKLMGGVDYRKLSMAMIILQIGILYILHYIISSNFYMTLELITSTALGILPHYVGVGKSHLMGVLIVPAIVIYANVYLDYQHIVSYFFGFFDIFFNICLRIFINYTKSFFNFQIFKCFVVNLIISVFH